jgi:hypothetical protein
MKSEQGLVPSETVELREDYSAVLLSQIKLQIERKHAGNDGKQLMY